MRKTGAGQTRLQNGSVEKPSYGSTGALAIVYEVSLGSSYSTLATYSVASGTETVHLPGPDNSVYDSSPLSDYLAFPAQLAFVPPSMSSSNGNFIAVADGTNYSVIQASTGTVVIAGTMPSAIRGTALGNSHLYLTLPDSNSLVSIPYSIP
jgi:hypothetical protein